MMTITDSTVSDNAAADGGGMYNFGELAVSRSLVLGNSADSIDFGGGIYNEGTLGISRSTVDGNDARLSGGGVYSIGTLTVARSTVSDNQAGGGRASGIGGGIANGGTMRITNSRIQGNTAIKGLGRIPARGGGIYNWATIQTINNAIHENVSEGRGGGIANDGKATVIRTTFSGNIAIFDGGRGDSGAGGGMQNRGTLTVTNSTFSENSSVNGGAIANYATLTIISSTLVLNRAASTPASGGGIGGGIWTGRDFDFSSTTLHNTIVAGNVRGPAGAEQPDDLSSARDVDPASAHNLIGDAGSSAGLVDGVNGNIVGVPLEEVLDPVLRDNGGPTLTHALIIGSPAVDAGSNPLVAAMTDQRGSGFARIADGNLDGIATVDIGAFELQQPAVVTLVENLLEKVEDLGLATGPQNSLTGKLDAVLSQMDAGTSNDQSLSAKLEAFIRGVEHWYSRGDITLAARDDLIDDAEFILLGLLLT
jgi:hypothetical protein